MAIEIRKVDSKSDLKKFIRFNYELYKDNPYSVPDLYEDSSRHSRPGATPHSSSAKPIISSHCATAKSWGAWQP